MRPSVAILVTLPLLIASVAAQDTQSLPHHVPTNSPDVTDWAQNLPLIGMQCVIAVWIFVLGSCFGSFLNVVIYRLPAGMSLGKPKSRCPRCETQLAARDNVPVLGWLILRGKCRYCGLPISARYPIIEAVCGGVFLTLLFTELLSGAANLPLRHPDHFHVNPGLWLVWFTKWDLSGIYFFHCCLMVVVLAIVMIGYDAHRPQRGLTAFGVITALLAGTLFSELRPVPAVPWSQTIAALQWGFWWSEPILNPGSRYWTGVSLIGLLDGIIGTLGGFVTGRLVCWQMTSAQVRSASTPVAAIASALTVTGSFLGWQACGMLLLFVLPMLAMIKWLVRNDRSADRLRWAGPGLFAMLLAFLILWQKLDNAIWMIGYRGWDFTPQDWRWDWMGTFVVLMLFAAAVRYGLKPLVPSATETASGEPHGRDVPSSLAGVDQHQT